MNHDAWFPVNENQAARLERARDSNGSWSDGSHLICQGYRLPPDADVDRLAWAVDQLSQRHDALRTVFDPRTGRQRVSGITPTLVEIAWDGRDCDPPVIQQPLDLGSGPTARFVLSRHKGHLDFWLTIEHLVADGWSLSVIERELAEMISSGQPLATRPQVQNHEYPALEAEYCGSAAGQRALAHWSLLLGGGTPWVPFNYPGSRLPEEAERSGTTSATLRLGAEATQGLRLRCQTHSVSAFVILLDALGEAIRQRSQLTEVGLVSPVANRWSAAVKETVTFASSLVPILLDLRDPVDQRLPRLRKQVLDAVRYGRYPIHRYTREKCPEEWGRRQTKPLLYVDVSTTVDGAASEVLGSPLPPPHEPVILGLGMWANLGTYETALTLKHPTGFLPDGELASLTRQMSETLAARGANVVEGDPDGEHG